MAENTAPAEPTQMPSEMSIGGRVTGWLQADIINARRAIRWMDCKVQCSGGRIKIGLIITRFHYAEPIGSYAEQECYLRMTPGEAIRLAQVLLTATINSNPDGFKVSS